MSLACDNPKRLMEDVEHIQVDAALLHKFVEGEADEVVQLGKGEPTPTIRKLVRDIDEREGKAAEEVIREGLASQMAIGNAIRKEMAEQVNKAKTEVAKIRGLSVRAVSLDEDDSATATYIPDTGRLVLGIPAGKTGPVGPIGPAGTAPMLGVMDFGGPEPTQLFVIDGGDPDTFRNPPNSIPDCVITLDNGVALDLDNVLFLPSDKSGAVPFGNLVIAQEII